MSQTLKYTALGLVKAIGEGIGPKKAFAKNNKTSEIWKIAQKGLFLSTDFDFFLDLKFWRS